MTGPYNLLNTLQCEHSMMLFLEHGLMAFLGASSKLTHDSMASCNKKTIAPPNVLLMISSPYSDRGRVDYPQPLPLAPQTFLPSGNQRPKYLQNNDEKLDMGKHPFILVINI